MKFNDKSFTLNGDLRVAIVDSRIPPDMEVELKRRNIDLIKSIRCEGVYDSISFHPDISVFNMGSRNIIVEPSLYEDYKVILDKYEINVIRGETYLYSKYPKDIAYNVAIVGDYAIHNFKYTDRKILEFIDENGLKKINVEQGYTKCSICIVDEKSVITSDKGIQSALSETDIKCLLIEPGHIDLFDMNYGFIGGCSGLIAKDKIAFLGTIKEHPSYEKIKEFVSSRNIEIVEFGSNRLLDLGSIIPIKVD